MATSINTGGALRWENDGVMSIWNTAGSTEYEIKGIHAGSVKWQSKPRQRIVEMDRGDFTGIVAPGDQQPNEIEVDVYVRKLGLTGATDLLAILQPAVASNAQPTFKCTFKHPDSKGATAGTLVTFGKCFLSNDGVQFEAAGRGDEFDHLRFKLIDLDGVPECTTY